MSLVTLLVLQSGERPRGLTLRCAVILCLNLAVPTSPVCFANDEEQAGVPREAHASVRSERAVLSFANATVQIDSVRSPARRDREETQNLEELHFSEGTFENLVFGARDSESDCFRRLNSELASRVELLGRVFDLTHSQKRKLLLAGKRDIENVRDRVERLKERFEEPLFVEKIDLPALHAWAFEFVKEAYDLRWYLHADPFQEGSMLAKVLRRQLTVEEISEYEQRELKLRAVPFCNEPKKSDRTRLRKIRIQTVPVGMR